MMMKMTGRREITLTNHLTTTTHMQQATPYPLEKAHPTRGEVMGQWKRRRDIGGIGVREANRWKSGVRVHAAWHNTYRALPLPRRSS